MFHTLDLESQCLFFMTENGSLLFVIMFCRPMRKTIINLQEETKVEPNISSLHVSLQASTKQDN